MGGEIMTIGKRIKARRKELKISAKQLGECLGVSYVTVYRYENGEIKNIPEDKLRIIAQQLNTTISYLMGEEQVPKSLDTVKSDRIKLFSMYLNYMVNQAFKEVKNGNDNTLLDETDPEDKSMQFAIIMLKSELARMTENEAQEFVSAFDAVTRRIAYDFMPKRDDQNNKLK